MHKGFPFTTNPLSIDNPTIPLCLYALFLCTAYPILLIFRAKYHKPNVLKVFLFNKKEFSFNKAFLLHFRWSRHIVLAYHYTFILKSVTDAME